MKPELLATLRVAAVVLVGCLVGILISLLEGYVGTAWTMIGFLTLVLAYLCRTMWIMERDKIRRKLELE
jgi:hypothetical protein